MRKQILLLVLGLISGCTQPSVTVVTPQSTAPIVKRSAVVPQVLTSSTSQTQASAVVTSNNQVVVMPDGTLMPKGNGQPENVVNPTPTSLATPTPYTNAQPYVPIATPTPILNNDVNQRPYSISYPVREGITSGGVTVTFKDEYEVRLLKNANDSGFKLISKSGNEQLKNVEDIFSQYGAKNFINFSYTEKEALDAKKLSDKSCNCDSVNPLSVLSIYIENQNMKEMIEKLRQNVIIREVNTTPTGSTGWVM